MRTQPLSPSIARSLSHNQSTLMVIKEGFTKDQFILKNDNDHTTTLRIGSAKFSLVETGTEQAFYSYLLLLFAIVLRGTLAYLFVNKRQPATSLTTQNV